MVTRGSITIAHWNGAPVNVHWSALLGSLVFTGFTFDPVSIAGFIGLILLHELGHAVAIKRFRGTVVSIDVNMFGGRCAWAGSMNPLQRSIIASGGIAAQAMLLGFTLLALRVFGHPTSPGLPSLVNMATAANIALIVLNLIPIPPLDGAEAWAIVPRLWEVAARARRNRQPRPEAPRPPRALKQDNRDDYMN